MKIIEAAPAPNPRRVRIFLAEKGIDMPFEQINIMEKAHKTQDFAALNPFQTVPVLVFDNGDTLSESIAICRYFEEQQPEPPLFGTGPLERATIEMWQRRVELGLLFRVAQTLRHTNPKMGHLESPQFPEWGEANRERVSDVLEAIDRQLTDHRYIAGSEYSVADITALVAMDFMKPARVPRPDGLDNLDRWYREVSARPSAKA